GQILEGAALGGAYRGQQGRLRAHDDNAQVGPELADTRHQIEPVLSGHHHVGDHQLSLALLHPLPERRRGAGAAHDVALPAERLMQDGADGAIVVGDEDGGTGTHGTAWRGSITRKMVRPASLSYSMAPPWSLTILATRARPKPVPVGLLVTKASKRCERISSDTPRPLSRTDTTNGRFTLACWPGTASRRPCLKAVDSSISRSPSPGTSQAFFTRLRKTWMSWSRSPNTSGSDGS